MFGCMLRRIQQIWWEIPELNQMWPWGYSTCLGWIYTITLLATGFGPNHYHHSSARRLHMQVYRLFWLCLPNQMLLSNLKLYCVCSLCADFCGDRPNERRTKTSEGKSWILIRTILRQKSGDFKITDLNNYRLPLQNIGGETRRVFWKREGSRLGPLPNYLPKSTVLDQNKSIIRPSDRFISLLLWMFGCKGANKNWKRNYSIMSSNAAYMFKYVSIVRSNWAREDQKVYGVVGCLDLRLTWNERKKYRMIRRLIGVWKAFHLIAVCYVKLKSINIRLNEFGIFVTIPIKHKSFSYGRQIERFPVHMSLVYMHFKARYYNISQKPSITQQMVVTKLLHLKMCAHMCYDPWHIFIFNCS